MSNFYRVFSGKCQSVTSSGKKNKDIINYFNFGCSGLYFLFYNIVVKWCLFHEYNGVSVMIEGLVLAVVGIGIVFLFLTTMVLVLTAMSKLVWHFFPEKLEQKTELSEEELKMVAAIAVAIRNRA
ncbi:Oxaloacetate decarboxylase gamma chain [Chitinispirillum alkaliphilum]|nr:Oxaloacetate decarboxylase gamma chain [Chitinispirillum alkaliphilum]